MQRSCMIAAAVWLLGNNTGSAQINIAAGMGPITTLGTMNPTSPSAPSAVPRPAPIRHHQPRAPTFRSRKPRMSGSNSDATKNVIATCKSAVAAKQAA